MSTALHLCGPDDADRLAPLLARFAAEFGLPDEGRGAAVAPLLQGSPYGMVYLLGPRSAPIGYVVVTLGWGIELGGMEAWIDEIWIRPSVRGRGIATEVLQALSTRLAAADVKAIHLEADRDAPEAHRLYRRAGFALRERHCLMTRVL
ncbi:GNAT family N-acetyltransferase [Wenxinia marina]|uniref:Acetyltransferase n=1 Tax=Wenxinia marina DSM 24838 TaxID=1123501 RepID=A0A0D0Q2G8_9RHOB|nr:GNAT family N-acetyltransferase [Wenxinia marina]KIQ68704.1 Acetyltransferase [Wenxinia marina DSM 24838]GGL65905.1 hypothetical protein GCM10011392_20670 [Wenxinia marina]